MNDTQLSALSLRELQDLQARLHTAIRAAIRAKREAKTAHHRPAAPTATSAPTLDLARERDAWIARRRAGSSVS